MHMIFVSKQVIFPGSNLNLGQHIIVAIPTRFTSKKYISFVQFTL